MKQNWWKLLVVAVLVVAVAGVVATKNKTTDKARTPAVEKSATVTSDDKPAVMAGTDSSDTAKPKASEPAASAEDVQTQIVDTAAVEKPKEETKVNDAAAKPAVKKPEVSAVKTEEPKPKDLPKAEPAKKPEKAKQLPKLLDLGATKCIPCKMMAPILEELSKEYKGKLEVVFIDVWEDREAGDNYGVKSIPTQIFYDTKGKEFFRHTGFLAKDKILAKFKEHDIDLAK